MTTQPVNFRVLLTMLTETLIRNDTVTGGYVEHLSKIANSDRDSSLDGSFKVELRIDDGEVELFVVFTRQTQARYAVEYVGMSRL